MTQDSQIEEIASYRAGPIPASAGVGLKAQHFQDIFQAKPDLGWFEVHAENYMGDGGLPHHYLSQIRQDYPLSVHGVGLSLGSADGVSDDHLGKLKTLIARYQPALVSEHVSWSTTGGVFFNDLLPLPYTEESLTQLVDNIDKTQNALGRTILAENPSTYVQFAQSVIPEQEFLLEIATRSGCGLLLDINNVYVSAHNHGFDPQAYLDSIPPELVGEIHLAGHAVEDVDGHTIRIDDHGSEVVDAVWHLFAHAYKRMAHVPYLIEWDANLPAFETLYAEAAKARQLVGRQDLRGEHDVLTA